MSPDIQTGRLTKEEYTSNFCDLQKPLDFKNSLVESARCYFCHDAPCIEACPTDINIPGFIRKISTGNVRGAAQEILEQNIMGATCARVCPVEELCQDACVRNHAEDKPVEIGKLQRFATDHLFEQNIQPFQRAPETGKRVAIVGAGPAGLSCAHRLAMKGHTVKVFEAREKSGGLNEYGLAPYKVVDNSVQKEIQFILEIGGIEIENGKKLGTDIFLDDLRKEYDAVFLGMGHSGVNALGISDEEIPGVRNAVDAIAEIRQLSPEQIPVGRRVLVIGGGNTAIDIAVEMKKLGAEFVTVAYRRGTEQMSATWHEQEIAQTHDVLVKKWIKPIEILKGEKGVTGVRFEYTQVDSNGKLQGTGRTIDLEADQVFKAIGQSFIASPIENSKELLELVDGRIHIGEDRKTSLTNVWAGGDCVPGTDLTVSAVQDGKIAAESIHSFLSDTQKKGA